VSCPDHHVSAFQIELWDRHAQHIRWVIAASASIAIANAALDVAISEYPGQRITLRKSAMVLWEHQPRSITREVTHKTSDDMRLFKYTTAETARKILENKTLRWSSPFEFNDPFDVQFDLHVDYDDKTIVDLIGDEVWNIYSGNKETKPGNRLGELLQVFKRVVPGLSKEELLERQALRSAISESVDRTKQLLPELHEKQRAVLAKAKILCFSEVKDSILMWSHYAGFHTGAVFEFEATETGDSALKKAEKVTYSKDMPRLMTEADAVRFFSGQTRLDSGTMLHDSIFVKAIEWHYEKEWRIWLAGTDAAQRFMDLKFDADDLRAITFGCRMSDEYKGVLLDTVKSNFSKAKIEQAQKSAREFALTFEPIAN
jgi:Protein of unknown function (DUF2971)